MDTNASRPKSRVLKKSRGFINSVSYVALVISGTTILVMTFHVALDVFTRNFFNAPIAGTLTFVTYWWLPIVVFLGMGMTESLRQHITVTLAIDGSTGRARLLAATSKLIVYSGVLGVATYYALQAAQRSHSIGEAIPADILLPIWPIKYIAFLGISIYFIQSIVSSVYDIRQSLRDKKTSNDERPEVLHDGN